MNMSKKKNIDRRNFFKGTSAAAATASGLLTGIPGVFLSEQANATLGTNKLVVVIKMGSMGGFQSGLVQPTDVNKWQKGAFVINEGNSSINKSVNPNINKHYKDGNLVFHNYSKILARVSSDLCTGTVFNRSGAHGSGMKAQTRGVRGNCGWLTAAANEFVRGTSEIGLISGSSDKEASINGFVSDITNIRFGSRLSSWQNLYRDANINKSPEFRELWDVYNKLTEQNTIPSNLSPSVVTAINTFEKNLFYGMPPELVNGSPLITNVENFINQAEINKVIDSDIGPDDDGEAIKGTFSRQADVFEGLKTAAVLAKSGLGKGVSMKCGGNHDMHNSITNPTIGTADIQSARDAAMVYAMIVKFWEFINANNLQDDVLVIVNHEFGRSAYRELESADTPMESKVFHEGNGLNVLSKGTQHTSHAGYYFLNGRLPGKSRIGAVGDNHSAFASDDARGLANVNMPAYLSTDIVPTVLMKAFPDNFNDIQLMRNYWQEFTGPVQWFLDM
jgi:hypothetical protein